MEVVNNFTPSHQVVLVSRFGYWDGQEFTWEMERAVCYPDCYAAYQESKQVVERTGIDCWASFSLHSAIEVVRPDEHVRKSA